MLSQPNSAVFDVTDALRRTEGDEDLLREMIALFLEEREALLAEIGQALAQRDPATLQHSAHSLKGALGALSARAASNAAFDLEQVGRAGDLDRAAGMYLALQHQVAALVPVLQAWRG